MNVVNACYSELSEKLKNKLLLDETAVILIDTHTKNGLAEQRRFFIELINNKIKTPVIIGKTYKKLSEEKQLQIAASIDGGALLMD